MIHKFTWRQETKQLKSNIDYMIIRQNSTIKVKGIRVFRDTECGFEHFLLKAKCVWQWTQQRTISARKEKNIYKRSSEQLKNETINIDRDIAR